MPIYEYSCGKCGKVVEKIQKFSDPPLKKHEGCGGRLTKLISQSSFQLKGSGWYLTDYAGKGKKESESGTADTKAESGSNGDSGTSAAGGEATDKTSKSEKPAKKKSGGEAKK